MNEEIEYAEMLEIPVSTVNVVKKKQTKKRKLFSRHENKLGAYLKESVLQRVNDKVAGYPQADGAQTEETLAFAENESGEGKLHFDDVPQRIDTVRLYSARENGVCQDVRLNPEDFPLVNREITDGENTENDGGMYKTNENNYPKPYPFERQETPAERRARKILGAEFIAACALCGAIFLTHVFMPGSAINTFFRSLENKQTATIDARDYDDFVLSGVVSDFSSVQLTLDENGVLTLQDECCVYPVADGTVREVLKESDGTYTVKIAHSENFSGVIGGLTVVYYEEGATVKENVPVGFTNRERAVEVTMYSCGELLNCFYVTEENCLAWVENV